ncbi:hypothetical protein MBLNU457_1893t1 [Dothideomycetes sp. NU457]
MASGLEAVGAAAAFLELAKAEIELVSAVLELLSGVFEQEAKDQTCSAETLKVASDIAAAYREVLAKLTPAVNRHISGRTRADGSNAISVLAIVAWPVREVKITALLAELERVNSNANLMLQMITQARVSKLLNTTSHAGRSVTAEGHITPATQASVTTCSLQQTSSDSVPFSDDPTAQKIISTTDLTLCPSIIGPRNSAQGASRNPTPEMGGAMPGSSLIQSGTKSDPLEHDRVPDTTHLFTETHMTPVSHATFSMPQETSSDHEVVWLAQEQRTPPDNQECWPAQEPTANWLRDHVKRIHDPDHLLKKTDLATSLSPNSKLVELCYNAGETALLEEMYKQALVESMKSLGKEHPTTVSISKGLAEIIYSDDDGDFAAMRLQSVLIDAEERAARERPNTVDEVDDADFELEQLIFESIDFDDLVSRWTKQA